MSCFQKETCKSSFLRDVAGGEDVGERTGRKKKESVWDEIIFPPTEAEWKREK